MSQESWTIVGTCIALLVALGGLMLTLSTWQRDDIQQVRTDLRALGAQVGEVQQGQTEMRERLARIETTIGIAHPNLNVQIDTQAKPNT